MLRTAVDSLAPTGECGVIGAPPFGAEVALDVHNILSFGRVVRGIVEGDSVPELFLPRLLELWRLGRFPVDRMMTLLRLRRDQRRSAGRGGRHDDQTRVADVSREL